MSETPRVLRANRAQLELRPTDLESLLPEDHRARVVWEFVLGLDLSAWPGRPGWRFELFAMVEAPGIEPGSA